MIRYQRDRCSAKIFSTAVFAFLIACEQPVRAQEPTAMENQNLRVALVQPHPSNDPAVNLERAINYCRQSKQQDADLVLFPEMFNVGYQTSIDFDDTTDVSEWRQKAQPSDGAFIQRFRRLAKDLELAIAITYLEDKDGSLRNATSMIDRHGELVFTYAKVHTCRFFPMEGSLVPGKEFFVEPLDTRHGSVNIGIMTCYDREFPETARVLMVKGAEVVLTPNACGLDHLRLKQFQVRAWENSMAVAMANYASGQGNGRSCGYAADGEELLLADEKEGIYLVDIDLRKMREYRQKTFWGNAWRRPQLYSELISPTVEEPFRRVDALGRPNTQGAYDVPESAARLQRGQ
jgi:predicted amidohydrolase